MNNYRKIMFIILIVSLAIMVGITGSTYAYYSYDIGNNVIDSQVLSNIDINYKEGNIIKGNYIPINSKYSYLYADKYNFEIIVDKKYANYEIGFLASFININLDKELYDWLDYIMYEIIDLDNNIPIIKGGSFKELKDNTLNLNKEMILLDTNYIDKNNRCYNQEKCTYKYQLRIWLKDNCIDSNKIQTCPDYKNQYKIYQEQNCKKINETEYDCSLTTKPFIYKNKQNEIQNKQMSMNLKIDTGLRK